jgi:hypothetical protein
LRSPTTVQYLKLKRRKHEAARRQSRRSYELLAGHPYTYREEDIAFEVYAILHDIPKAAWPKQRERFLSKGHPHLRVSALPKRYGWGIHNDTEGKVARVAVESSEYKRLLNDPRITKVKAFRSTRASAE